jgi:hypothetical protein
MNQFRDLIRIIESNQEQIDEAGAGPSRVVTHIRGGTPFFMVSAFRADIPHAENIKRNDIMRKQLASIPATSFIQTSGEYQEVGQEQPSEELSFFVLPRKKITNMEMFHKIGLDLMSAFSQDSIILGDGETVSLAFSDGSQMNIGNAVTFRMDLVKKADGHSSVRGRKFTFKSLDDAPQATPYGNSAMADEKRGSATPVA